MKEREADLMQKETKIILKAKKQYGINFEDPNAMAKNAQDEELKDRYEQL